MIITNECLTRLFFGILLSKPNQKNHGFVRLLGVMNDTQSGEPISSEEEVEWYQTRYPDFLLNKNKRDPLTFIHFKDPSLDENFYNSINDECFVLFTINKKICKKTGLEKVSAEIKDRIRLDAEQFCLMNPKFSEIKNMITANNFSKTVVRQLIEQIKQHQGYVSKDGYESGAD
jgi:hypothetical protein